MVPSVFTCAAGNQDSELDLASGWEGVDNAKKVLEKHWDTFITEDDFKYLAKIGINTVRLPLGFWSLGTNFTKGSVFEKYGSAYENSWPRVLRAIGWAGQNGIGVLADLHGAYGSQNGKGNLQRYSTLVVKLMGTLQANRTRASATARPTCSPMTKIRR